jgi:DNA-binding transcriptional MocR family regulator
LATIKGFYQVPNTLLQEYGSQIGAYGIAVYNAILLHDFGNDRCYPSQTTIAQYLNCDRKTVNRAIRKLVELGLLEVDHRGNDTGQTSNRYRPKLVVSSKPQKVEAAPLRKGAGTIGFGTVKKANDSDDPPF